MTMKNWSLMRLLLAGTVMGAGATALATPAAAQVTTATIRGVVTDTAGRPVAGARVVARDIGTNQSARAVSGPDGAYSLNNVNPTTYDVVFTGPDGKTFTTRVIVSVGQSASLDGVLGAPTNADTTGAAESGVTGAANANGGAGANAANNAAGNSIVVTGRRLIELKTSEVATNVSQKQIQALPQTDRNFLSFAALAPGVNYIDGQTNKGIQSGASTRSSVNVFIDGVSLKNQALDGGIAGQQDSRGNPFSQLAVQEFRVLTQNYKAEYEQAGAAIVTAVTKSGTNEIHGEVFGQYTGKDLSEKDYFSDKLGLPKPEFERKQYGASLGGPIIKDKLFFFASYERNTQDRAVTVLIGNPSVGDNLARFGQYQGQFVSPFEENLYFGKLTWTPTDRNTIDLSYSRREENEIQNFGGQKAFSQAEQRDYFTETGDLKWKYRGDVFVNEFAVNYLNNVYNPSSLNPDDPSLLYTGVINIGGKNGSQDIDQRNYTVRDDITFSGLSNHVIKGGLRVNLVKYRFNKPFFQQPEYVYVNDPTQNEDFSTPSTVQLGLGNPTIKSSDTELGVYAQDDWNITRQLQVNLGIRWDYETNMFDNDYTTAPNAAAVFQQLPQTSYFGASNYITDGNQRGPYLGMIQPRFGFSYDVFSDQHTVIFGGVGRYFDRNIFNNTLDERIRTQYQIGTLYFSKDGLPRQGFNTIVWNPAYMSRDALLALRASAQTGQPELFSVPNNGTPPRTDQFSFGLRQKVYMFEVSVSGSYIKGSNGYTTLFASRNPDGSCCDNSIPNKYGYADALIGYSGLDTRYKALYVTIDKPYTTYSHWGLDVAYTFSKGIQDGNDLFSLDAVTPRAYGFRANPFDQRHKIVFSGIVDLPYGFQFSTLTTLGTGQALTLTDASAGTGIGIEKIRAIYPPANCAGVFAYCEVNISLEKDFHLFRHTTFGLAVDLFNVFNNDNFIGYPTFLGPGQSYVFDNSLQKKSADGSILYGQPTDNQTLPRRLQVRAFYRF